MSYGRHAATWLAVAIGLGAWLRLVLVHPPALAGFEFRHAVHAHSHVALFGWATMALFGFIAGAGRVRGRWVQPHVLLTSAATAAAFVGFLRLGYTPLTIGIATAHVVLWYVFAIGAWRAIAVLHQPTHDVTRGALAFLAIAGAGALVPGIVRARGHDDPWLLQLSVELFLTPYIEGWLVLGVAAIVYDRLPHTRYARAVLRLVLTGALPAALLRVPAAPPGEWLVLVGRAGTACIGVAALLLARDALRSWRLDPLLTVTGGAALLKGTIDVVVAAAGAGGLAANHQLKIGYLHLLLLGIVTPALLTGAVLRRVVHPVLGGAYALGLAVQLAAVAAIGTPAAGAWLAMHGVSVRGQMATALAGGLVSAVSILGMLLRRP